MSRPRVAPATNLQTRNMKRKLLFIFTQLLTLTALIVWILSVIWTCPTALLSGAGVALIATNIITVLVGLRNWWQNYEALEAWKKDTKASVERQCREEIVEFYKRQSDRLNTTENLVAEKPRIARRRKQV